MNYLWNLFFFLQTGEVRLAGGWRIFVDKASGNLVIAKGASVVAEFAGAGDVSIGGSLAQGA